MQNSGPGAQSFVLCLFFALPGRYGVLNSTNACGPCPKGTYSSPVRGVNQCISCPGGTTTILRDGQVGANSIVQCVCDAGYGTSPANNNTCQACISPSFQGQNVDGVITTTASLAQPRPQCIACAGAVLVPPTQVTGDINGLCTAGSTRPSAYCVNAGALACVP